MSTATLDWKQKPHFMGLLLGGFALLVCVLVALGAQLTDPLIALRTQEDTQKLLDQVIPADLYDVAPTKEPITLTLDGQKVEGFRARKEGKVTAVALFAETQGYGGTIRLLLGIDAHGVLTGVRVLSHSETPGLGDKIQTNKSDWILGFAGLSLGNPDEQGWHVKKDGGQFDGFTGATITPRAVVKGVHETLALFAKHSAALLDSKE